ncbi:(4Fe-4S)-binding protein [Methanobrevibacter sp. 87.7]|nr:(4Fe-4S)-binding protein [Methanobrevibacter sp. 87.7]
MNLLTKEKVKEYSYNNFTVVWNAKKCIHAGECWRNLPEVFKPAEKPWVKINIKSPDEIKEVIDKCPSGALSYKEN